MSVVCFGAGDDEFSAVVTSADVRIGRELSSDVPFFFFSGNFIRCDMIT